MGAVARAIWHVDAFTSVPLEGNPAAVVEGEGLDGETMQRIALNQKLSETVFLLPAASASNHARLRIFTPAAEVPFAGHPTIAAAHILTSEGRVQMKGAMPLLLETGAGVIPVAVADASPRYTMTQARPQFRECSVTRDEIARGVGLTASAIVRAAYVSTGLEWLVAQVASPEDMMRVKPDYVALMPHNLSIFCIGGQAPGASVHVRAFAPAAGVYEDPVTGSANGCIAALIAREDLLPAADGVISYVAEQGSEMGQPGRVYARITGVPDDLTVEIGGDAVTVLRGELHIPAA